MTTIIKEGKNIVDIPMFGLCPTCGCEFQCSRGETHQKRIGLSVAYTAIASCECPNLKCSNKTVFVYAKEPKTEAKEKGGCPFRWLWGLFK